MRSAKDLAQAIAPDAVRAAGAVRRMTISLTTKTLWQLLGHKMPDGQQETFTAEAFTGIGFYSRPASGGHPEAIVLNIGNAKAPVIVAVRDERTRAAMAGSLAVNETAMFNDAAIVHVKADGSIEARSKNGTAQSLATKADLDALAAYLKNQFATSGTGHTHTLASGGVVTLTTVPTATPGTGSGVPSATGTTKVRAE